MYCFYDHYTFVCSKQGDEEHLPDVIWCRDPFMEVLNEIKDIVNFKKGHRDLETKTLAMKKVQKQVKTGQKYGRG